MTWFERSANRTHVERIRTFMTENVGRVVLFLGAGLSFGSSRRGRKSLAELDRWGRLDTGRGDDDTTSDPAELVVNDDDEPFPTWSRLKSRMRAELARLADQDQASLNRFFRASGPLDCAQLFRNLVGRPNYFEFLRSQFEPPSPVDYWITPSHTELVALGLPLLFTTNYDNLVERAYTHCRKTLTVSSTADEFIAHLRPPKCDAHLVKIHGSIDNLRTVVLTRDDYAQARIERSRIYGQLRFDIQQSTYLFVGFSLSDPNINILLDDARLETGGTIPPSYTVQGRYDRATDEYYRSMGVNVIWIDTWDFLPSFIHAINPKYDLETARPGGWDI
jgi:hypothetical protein